MKGGSSSYAYLGKFKTRNICNNFNILCALKTQVFNIHIYFCYGRAFVRLVNFTGGLSSAQSFSWEGFCPPCYFHGRAFIRPVIFTRGLLSALSFFDGSAFVREGFCPFPTVTCSIRGPAVLITN
jgi:hypothetical protein